MIWRVMSWYDGVVGEFGIRTDDFDGDSVDVTMRLDLGW